MARQIREILVRVDTKGSQGLKTISRDLGRISKDVNTTARATAGLRTAFNALAGLSFAGFGIGGLVRASDEIQLLRDRISVFEGSTEAANATLEDLIDVSARTAAPLATSAISYNRLALALDDIGVKGDALLGTVETLQNTFRLAGSTIAETRGAVIQLSQGLASGELRGQELRSVLEANAIAGEILAKQLGVARGELIKFSEKRGGIASSEVLQALANASEELQVRASKLSLTFEQSLALAFNKVQLGILKVNDSFGIAEKFAISLNFAVVNLADGFTILAASIIALKLPAIAAGLSAAGAAIAQAVGSIAFLASLAGGIKGLVLVLGVAAAKFLAIAGAIALAIKAITDFEGFKLLVERTLLTVEDKFLKAQIAVERFFGALSFSEKGRKNQLEVVARLEERRLEIASRLSKNEKEEIDRTKARTEALKAAAEEQRRKELLDGGQITNLAQLNFRYEEGILSLEKYREELLKFRRNEISNLFSEGKIDLDERDKRIKALTEGASKASQKFKLLNEEFQKTGNLEQYSAGLRALELENINKQFDEGTSNLLDFQDALAKVKLQDLTKELNRGVISFREFTELSNALQIEELNRKFSEGTIGLKQYNEELNKVSEKFSPGSVLFVGTANYIESAGTLATNVSSAITSTFNRLEDTLVEFTKNGRFEFAKFTQAILDDLTKIIIRASIIQPLAQGILNFAAPAVGSFSGGGGALSAGVGGAGSTLTAFASGGVVDSPTFFSFGQNQRGVAGEAGPEAIVPLKRTASGDLGVQSTPSIVNVNIINNAGVEVETREATNDNGERSIEVLIVGTVKEAMGKGAFDRQFSNQFGLRRRGA